MCEEVTERRARSGADAARGGVDGQHRGAGPHAAAGRLGDAPRRARDVQRAHPRVLVDTSAPAARSPGRAGRAPAAPAARWRRRARTAPRRKRGESQRARTRPRVERLRRARAARRRGSRRATRRGRARSRPSRSPRGVNQASTPCSSHHAPIARRSRPTRGRPSSARSRPKRSTSDGRCVHSVSQKPPLRPLGPCPHTSASSSDDRRAARAQLPGRPQPGVAAADDDDVGGRASPASAGAARPPRPPSSQ